MDGKDWFSGFMKRNQNVTLLKPEATSLNRIITFNRTSVKTFFDNLLTVQENHELSTCRIYNMDETRVSSVQKSGRIVASKGELQIENSQVLRVTKQQQSCAV